MDITQQFKASVMTVKLQKNVKLPSSSTMTKNTKLDKNRILSKGAAIGTIGDDFARQAKDVCNKITSLRNVLLENRTAYMRIGQHLKSATTMTDEQRDLIDRESEKFVTHYTQYLAQMRADWKRVKHKKQEREHMEAVLDLLVSYLHSVQQIYLDQKKYRVQHELETYRLLKLASDKKKIPVRPAGEQSGKLHRRHKSNGRNDYYDSDYDDDDVENNARRANAAIDNIDADWNDSWEWGDDDDDDDDGNGADNNENSIGGGSGDHRVKGAAAAASARKHQSTGRQPRLRANGKTKLIEGDSELKKQSSKVALDEDLQKTAEQLVDEEETNTLSPEDVQMFEEENMQLYSELQGLSAEVEQIEKNVVDIAQLQDIFTEKVSLQQHNIDRIASAVVGATENVKDANEQIRQATQRNAGIRVWSLFFLLVMSFSLLFLDWYYD